MLPKEKTNLKAFIAQINGLSKANHNSATDIYLVEVAFKKSNPIHKAILTFCKNSYGTFGHTIHSNGYEINYSIRDVYYIKLIGKFGKVTKAIDMPDLWLELEQKEEKKRKSKYLIVEEDDDVFAYKLKTEYNLTIEDMKSGKVVTTSDIIRYEYNGYFIETFMEEPYWHFGKI